MAPIASIAAIVFANHSQQPTLSTVDRRSADMAGEMIPLGAQASQGGVRMTVTSLTVTSLTNRANLSDWTVVKARDVLAGRRRGWGPHLAFVGPSLIASIAYMDPGNFATNIQAGAKYGYELLWVVLLSNLVAMLFQALSAKLGIVTGYNLAELCRDQFPKPVVLAMWAVSEIAAMATDLAEFVGGAIGLSLIFHMPLLAGMAVIAVVVYVILTLSRSGFRPFEMIVGGFVGVIALSYLTEVFLAPVNWGAVALHAVTPQIADSDALLLAVGIIGATVMPHAIYLHSGLTQARIPPRNDAERKRLIRASNGEVIVTLSLAGLVNVAMVLMAAAAFHLGHSDVAEIETAYHSLTPLLGPAAGVLFLVSLLASGISSSAVGTMAGQVIMQGFVGFTIPIWLRRAAMMLPAFLVVALGMNATSALIGSQVVLSIALPLPMIALVIFTGRPAIMGRFASTAAMRTLAMLATVFVIFLNVFLVLETMWSA